MDGPLQSVPDGAVALHVAPTAGERAAKRRALAAHRSQTGPLVELVGAEVFDGWWVDEHFRAPTAGDLARAVASPPLEAVAS